MEDGASTDAAGGAADAVLERARRYVEIETPTGDETACRRLAELLADDLRVSGGEVRLIEAPGWGAHVSAAFAPLDAREDAAPLLVLGHLDTVHPLGTLERQPFRRDGERVYGPGLYDMKGPLALIVEALLATRRGGARRRPVTVLITCDEEQGSTMSRALIESTARACGAVLVAEPPMPDGGAKTARKGVGMYEVHVRGVAAHAGIEPDAGASAIHALATFVRDTLALARPELGTTINVGRVRGGTTGNVVAASAFAELDIRFATAAEGTRVEAGLRAWRADDARLEVRVQGGVNRPPLVRDEEVLDLFGRARSLARDAGFDLAEGATGGGSDGCFTAAAGVPTLDGLGLPGGGAHTSEEHVLLAPIAQRLEWWARMLASL